MGRRLSLRHTAFVEAMRQELKPWEKHLSFEAEHLLNAAPLVMDLLIIKKRRNLVIDNKIAAIFRSHNIIEYKNPRDNISIFDFNKVCGYAYIYSALRKVPLEDITVTFIEDPRPRNLFAYLRNLGCTVEEKWAGIYSIQYAKIAAPAIQFIERKRLSSDDNLWLKSLSYGLGAGDLKRVLDESLKDAEPAVKGAYLDLLLTVNRETVKEMTMMKVVTWRQIFEEAGESAQIREWEERMEKRAEKRVEERLTAQVEKRVTAQVEKRVTAQVEKRVTAQVEKRVTAQVEKRVTAQVEKRAAAEREQLKQENERLRRENERLRAAIGA